jgi:hypothetical protein
MTDSGRYSAKASTKGDLAACSACSVLKGGPGMDGTQISPYHFGRTGGAEMPREIAEMFIAASHVTLAIVVSAAWFWAGHKAGEWWGDRVQARCVEDFSIDLGVPASVLRTELASRQFIKYLSDRYSGESFRNRLSDLVDDLLFIFEGLCILAQLVVAGVVLWGIFSSGTSQAATIWILPLIGVFSTFIQSIVAVLCMGLFGRFPAEAKYWRKFVARSIERRAAMQDAH